MEHNLIRILGAEGCIDILRDISNNGGHPKLWYSERSTSGNGTVYKRIFELEDAGLITSKRLGKNNASTLHITDEGDRVLGIIDVLEGRR